MYALLAFTFASDAAAADKSDATIVPTGLQIGNSGTVCKLSHLDELHTALLEILGQADDGVDDTEKRVVAGAATGGDLLVKYTRTSDTVIVGTQPLWTRAKARAFCDALVAFGLVAAAEDAGPGPVVRG